MTSSLYINNLHLYQHYPIPISVTPQFLTHRPPPKAAIFSRASNLHWTSPSNSRTKLAVRASMASTPSTAETEAETIKPFSVLFVCLGNICRSPAAEGVFTDLVTKKGLNSKFTIDSAGTINYHEGNQADPRMRATAKSRGILITSLSRPIRPSDFRDFDLIIAMDKQNREAKLGLTASTSHEQPYECSPSNVCSAESEDILGALERWRFKETLPPDAHKKVRLMCSYCKKHSETEVPDPYYGGQKGFEKVLDLLEDACDSLLENILAEKFGQKDS